MEEPGCQQRSGYVEELPRVVGDDAPELQTWWGTWSRAEVVAGDLVRDFELAVGCLRGMSACI